MRDIGVTAEVAVDLHRVAVDRQQDLQRGVTARVPKTGSTICGRDVAREHDLLEQAGPDEIGGSRQAMRRGSRRAPRRICGRRSEPRTIGPATRCGKKATKTATSRPRRRLEAAPVDVDDVGQPHKGEKGDAHGKCHLEQRYGIAGSEVVDHVVDVDAEPSGVLEPAEQSELGRDRDAQPGTLGRRAPRPMDQAAPGDRAGG